MGYQSTRREAPDELDRLLAAALRAAVSSVQAPAHLSAAVCAAASQRPQPVARRSRLRTMIDVLMTYLLLGEDRRPVPVIMHSIGFVDVGALAPGLAWSWELYRGVRSESSRQSVPWKYVAAAG